MKQLDDFVSRRTLGVKALRQDDLLTRYRYVSQFYQNKSKGSVKKEEVKD